MAATETDVALAVLAGALSGAGASFITLVYSSAQDRRDRHREHFSRALEAVARYEEFPYVVRRRKAGDPEGERVRISTDLREVQADLSYHCTWLLTESREVADAYSALVTDLRARAGRLIHDGWAASPIQDDAEMNIPDIASELAELQPLKERYLLEVTDHLSVWPRWLRRLMPRKSPHQVSGMIEPR